MSLKLYKEFLTTGSGTEGSVLIARTLAEPMVEEVEKAVLPRSLARRVWGPADIPGSSIDVQKVDESSFNVWAVAEGASIPIGTQTYTNVNIKPKKYGVRPAITKEMLEDSKFPLLELNLRQAGRQLAYNENSLVLTELDGAGNSVTGGAAATVANVINGVQLVREDSYSPDTMLVGDEFLADLMNIDTFTEADKWGSNEMQQKGIVGTIFGLNVIRFDLNAAPTTTYSKYCYIFDSKNAYDIAEKRPVSVQNWDDLVHDMSGLTVTQRVAIGLIRANAVCRVTTT